MKLIPSAVLQAEVPAPLTVNVSVGVARAPGEPNDSDITVPPALRQRRTRRSDGKSDRGRVCQAARGPGNGDSEAAHGRGAARREGELACSCSAGGREENRLPPLGIPDALKLTLPVKPFWRVTVMVLAPLEPWVRLTLLGAAESAKSGAPFTVRVRLVELVKLPEVPVMVTVAVPAVAVLLAESVSTLLVEVLLGLKEAVTPLGRPDAERLTLPANPPWGAKESWSSRWYP